MSIQSTITIPPAAPIRYMPPICAGEIDGRYVNCKPDLGPFGDTFPSIEVLSVAITRADGQPMGSNDLQIAGVAWPNTLDASGLIPSFGFTAPSGNTGVSYILTLTANKTTQGRLWIRTVYMDVVTKLG